MTHNPPSPPDMWVEEKIMEDLKPCRFCGKRPVMSTTPSGYFYIECLNGSCRVRPLTWAYPTKEEAISAWNDRVS